jgi:integrase
MAKCTINIILRTDKRNSDGRHPLVVTVSVANQLKKLSTGIAVFPEQWDTENKEIIYLNRKTAKKLLPNIDFDLLPSLEDTKNKNTDLKTIVANIEKIAQRFNLDNTSFSSTDIIDNYKRLHQNKGKKEDSSKHVFEYIDKYIEENKHTRAKGSLSVYKSLKNHLLSYEKIKNIKVRFDKMNYEFFSSFQNFLINHKTDKGRTLNNITIAKQLSTLKTFLNYAKRSGIKVSDGFKDFVIKRQKLEVIALTEEEFYKLVNLDLSNNKRLDQVRDVFVFGCTVGYRYSDLKQLSRHHIKGDTIYLTTEKTKTPLITPLNEIALNILQKYARNKKPLPIISNQKYNKYLTEVCELAELNEEIEIIRFKGAEKIVNVYPKWLLVTAHTSRKTFASILISKQVPYQVIMTLGGWSDFKSFQRYIKIEEDTLKNIIKSAWI